MAMDVKILSKTLTMITMEFRTVVIHVPPVTLAGPQIRHPITIPTVVGMMGQKILTMTVMELQMAQIHALEAI